MPSDVPPAIGARIRNARVAQGLTLAQIAAASGLTKGFLSRVERDETSPSVATLVQLCQVLSLSPGALFAEPEIQKVSLADAPLIYLGGHGVDERLLSPRGESRVQIVRSTMEPGASGGTELFSINSQVEFVHVLQGCLTVHFVDRDIELDAGDALTFPGREPHNWHTEGGAEVIWVIAPATWSSTG